jgi:TIR domain/Effector-associated domain 1
VANVRIAGEDKRLLLDAAILAVRRHEELEWVLDDIGFPHRSRPDDHLSIEGAWRSVLRELDAGIMADGYPKLIDAFLSRYPANPAFSTLHKRYPTAVVSASPARAGAPNVSAGLPVNASPGSLANTAGHVFISYAREDAVEVDRLRRALEAARISVWLDTADLWPGEDWRVKIRHAITEDAFVLLACFSTQSLARKKSYQNEELLLAIDQIRLRRPDDPWLIPVRFDDCDLPEYDLGNNRSLSSIQRADLFAGNFGDGAARLVEAIRRILAR